MLVELPAPTTLSYSQKTTYRRCGEQYRLERIFKVPQRPGWALLGGSAVHHASEDHDWGEFDGRTMRTFDDYLDEEIAEKERDQPSFTKDQYKVSGRASAQWPNKEDEAWWRFHGPAMVNRYITWKSRLPWDIYLYGGKPAIELKLEPVVGEATVVAYVDRVFQIRSTGDLVVVDIKTGSRPIKTTVQLGDYKVGLEYTYGEPVKYGTHWMARSGEHGQLAILDAYTQDRMQFEYETFQYERDKGLFVANPGDACGLCSAQPWCYAQSGEFADQVRRPWEDRDAWEAQHGTQAG